MAETDATSPAVDSAGRFYESVWPHAAVVLRLAMLVSADRAGAEELAHQTLMEAAKSIDQRGEADWQAWVLGILHKRCTGASAVPGLKVDERVYHSAAASHAQIVAADPKEVLSQLSDEQVLLAVRSLPEKMRWTMLLLDVAGLSASHVAVILELPVWTIDAHVKQAHDLLRDVLVPLASEVNATDHNQVFERR